MTGKQKLKIVKCSWHFCSFKLGLRSPSIIPRVKLRLCLDRLIRPSSGSHTVTSLCLIMVHELQILDAVGEARKMGSKEKFKVPLQRCKCPRCRCSGPGCSLHTCVTKMESKDSFSDVDGDRCTLTRVGSEQWWSYVASSMASGARRSHRTRRDTDAPSRRTRTASSLPLPAREEAL